MRVAVPVIDPVWLIFSRVGLGALVLAAVALQIGSSLGFTRHWRHFLVLGLFNAALPWLLYAYAAKMVSASLMSIMNSTAPMWAALIGAIWTRRMMSLRAAAGLLLGVAGVAVLAGGEALMLPAGGGMAITATLMAAACYGFATVYAKSGQAVEPLANAQGTMLAATLLIFPLLTLSPWPDAMLAWHVAGAVLALGVVCSGLAFLLYFRLVADVGPTSALTVAFLIPVFGVLWGALFLNEAVGWHTLAGCVIVLTGTAMVTGFSPRALRRLRDSRGGD